MFLPTWDDDDKFHILDAAGVRRYDVDRKNKKFAAAPQPAVAVDFDCVKIKGRVLKPKQVYESAYSRYVSLVNEYHEMVRSGDCHQSEADDVYESLVEMGEEFDTEERLMPPKKLDVVYNTSVNDGFVSGSGFATAGVFALPVKCGNEASLVWRSVK